MVCVWVVAESWMSMYLCKGYTQYSGRLILQGDVPCKDICYISFSYNYVGIYSLYGELFSALRSWFNLSLCIRMSVLGFVSIALAGY